MKLWSAAEAVAAVRSYILKHGERPAEAVESLWGRIRPRLDHEAQEWLMMQGLRDRVTDALHFGRYCPPVPKAAALDVTVSYVPSAPSKDLFLHIVYSVGSEVKALQDFTETDCYTVATKMKQEAAGKLAVAAWMEEVAGQLKQAQVTQVKELPADVLSRLQAHWPMLAG